MEAKYKVGENILVRMSNNISKHDTAFIRTGLGIKKGVWYSAIVSRTRRRQTRVVFNIDSHDMKCCLDQNCAYLEGHNWIIKKNENA